MHLFVVVAKALVPFRHELEGSEVVLAIAGSIWYLAQKRKKTNGVTRPTARPSMRHNRPLLVTIGMFFLILSGCQASRDVGKGVVAVPFILAEGLLDGLLDDEDSFVDRERRQSQRRQWKQYWRDHPEESPAMHDAFKDDYE